MKIVTAILDGQRDPYVLADLRDKRVKASREEVARSPDHWGSRIGHLIEDKLRVSLRPRSKRGGRICCSNSIRR